MFIIAVFFGLSSTTLAAPGKRGAFNLAITTHLGDVRHFREGDIVSFYVSLDKDAYLIIIYQDANNHLNLLIPNSLYRDNLFKAGLFIPIPNEQNPFQFRISAPFGKETLWVFASDQPFPALTTHSEDGNNTRLAWDIKTIRTTLKDHSRRHQALFEESSLTLYTSAASPSP
jgi:hypothetical protein